MAKLSLKDVLKNLLSNARDFSDALSAFSTAIDGDRMQVKEKNRSLVEKLQKTVDKTLNKCPPVTAINQNGHLKQTAKKNDDHQTLPEQNERVRVTTFIADVRVAVTPRVNGHRNQSNRPKSPEKATKSPASTISKDNNDFTLHKRQKINRPGADKQKNPSLRDSNLRENLDGDRNRDSERVCDQNAPSRDPKQRKNSDRDRKRERDQNPQDRRKNENRKEFTDCRNAAKTAADTKNGSEADGTGSGTERTVAANDEISSAREKTGTANCKTDSSKKKLISMKENERRRSDSSYNRYPNMLKRKSLHDSSEAQVEKFHENLSLKMNECKDRRRSSNNNGDYIASPTRHQETSAYYTQQTKQLKVIDLPPRPPNKKRRRP